MTNEQLDRARAEEANRRWTRDDPSYDIEQLAILAAKLAREGWTPPDPLLREARVIAAEHCYEPEGAIKTLGGHFDTHHPVKIALAALRRGMELAKAP